MPNGLHILGFQNKLKENKPFLKSLLCQRLSKRKLIIEKASPKELQILQKLIIYCLRGEIEITKELYNQINRSKKLPFIEQNFRKIAPQPQLRHNLLKLLPLLHLFVKRILKK